MEGVCGGVQTQQLNVICKMVFLLDYDTDLRKGMDMQTLSAEIILNCGNFVQAYRICSIICSKIVWSKLINTSYVKHDSTFNCKKKPEQLLGLIYLS